MRKRIQRPSPALVISLIALFVAMGGVGYAAVKIDGKNLKSKSVAGKKLKNKTITAGKVKDNTLGGAQIAESKLGKVPSTAKADSATSATSATTAGSATTASNVSGVTLRKFSFNAPANTAEQTVLNVGGLIIRASCSGAGDLAAELDTTVPDAVETHQGFNVGASDLVNDNGHSGFDPGANYDFLEENDNYVNGVVNYSRPDGGQVTVSYQVKETAAGFNACLLAGTAIAG
jgi:hypothetical protein